LALDSTSAFYLFEDGQQAFQAYQSGIAVSSLNTEFKQFYPDTSPLPDEVKSWLNNQDVINSKDVIKNEVSLILTTEEDIYLLPYQENNNAPVIYVVHRFEKQETQDISPVLFVVSFAVLFLMFALMWLVVKRLQQQSKKLSGALQDVAQSDIPVNFDIQEFQRIYDDVRKAYEQRLKVLQREKHYSAFLSHEIRHSLAAINANIEKLDQIDGFPLDALAPMGEAKHQSNELQRLANAILALWQTQRLTSSSIVVAQELKAISKQLDFGELQLNWQINVPDLELQCDPDLFHLLARQLLQNAIQYAESSLTINLTDGQLTLSNDVCTGNALSGNHPVSNNPVSINKEYGHQVGMYLIEKICDTMGWQFQVSNLKSEFKVVIAFALS
jgi:signal transduction histidine kinase